MNRNNPIATFVREQRKQRGITQEEFAILSGVSLSFLRALEQGKETLQIDNVNRVLRMFNYEVGPIPIKKKL